MPRKGGKRKKTRTHVEETQQRLQGQPAVPKSFVFKHGKVPSIVQDLISDFRHVMRPFTASKLKVSRHNGIKDLVKVAAPLGVSHLVFFTASGKGTNMKLARLPRGPTLSFKVTGYSLMKHIHAMQKRPVDPSQTFQTPPLVVLNNFNRPENHIKLMHITFQSMFPAIDVQTIKLSDCRRVVLFNYDTDSDQVEFRQYSIRANPLGVSRSVKTILKSKVPNLHKLDDISDFLSQHITGSNYGSDSEMEDEAAHVTMPDAFMGCGNSKAEKSAIRCSEIGPRMTLKLVKVEREICEGDVLYHAYNTKTPEEAAAAKTKKEAAVALKTSRRLEQEANVEKKQAMKDEKKAAKAARKEAREKNSESLLNLSSSEEEANDDDEESESEYPEDLPMPIEDETPQPENFKTKEVESSSGEIRQEDASSSYKKKRKLLIGNAPKQQAQHLAKKKK